jgi:hypothetical protein
VEGADETEEEKKRRRKWEETLVELELVASPRIATLLCDDWLPSPNSGTMDHPSFLLINT